jgi:hypothetical protein
LEVFGGSKLLRRLGLGEHDCREASIEQMRGDVVKKKKKRVCFYAL